MRTIRLRRAVTAVEVRRPVRVGEDRYIGLEHITPWTGLLNFENDAKPDGLVNVFKPGDILFGKLRPYLAKVALAKAPGVCSTEVLVLRPGPDHDPRFIRYVLATPNFIDRVNAATFGAKMPRASWRNIGGEEIPRIPLEDQRRIADFLDSRLSLVEDLVAARIALMERSAKVLEFRKEALLTPKFARRHGMEAVPSRAILPDGWQLRRLNDSILDIDQGWSPVAENRVPEAGEWGVLKVGCVNHGRFDASESKALSGGLVPPARYAIHPGDLLMSRGNTRDLVGSAAVVGKGAQNLIMSDLLFRLSVRASEATTSYLAAALGSRFVRRQIAMTVSGASDTMPKINQAKIRSLYWLRPPLGQQEKISQEIAEHQAWFDRFEAVTSASLEKLRDYRTALITAAVTGQIDIASYGKRGATDRVLDRIEAEMEK